MVENHSATIAHHTKSETSSCISTLIFQIINSKMTVKHVSKMSVKRIRASRPRKGFRNRATGSTSSDVSIPLGQRQRVNIQIVHGSDSEPSSSDSDSAASESLGEVDTVTITTARHQRMSLKGFHHMNVQHTYQNFCSLLEGLSVLFPRHFNVLVLRIRTGIHLC